MKLFRVVSVLILFVVTAAPAVGVASPAAAAPVIDAPRGNETTANRSAKRSLPLVVAAAVTPATTSPTTSPAPVTTPPTTPPTTQAPVPTTAKVKKAAVTTTTAAPAVAAAVTEAAAPAPAPVDGDVKAQVAAIARAQVGKAYRSGATGPNAFDCSGLVFYVYNQAGIAMPRLTSDGYFAKSTHIKRGELQPGDIVVSSGHMGVYVGGGQMVHASTPRGGVKLASIDVVRPIGYGRL